MAEKIGWELFRVEYKAALEKGDDVGTAIADSYDKAIKTAVPGIPYFGGTQKGQGSATRRGCQNSGNGGGNTCLISTNLRNRRINSITKP